MSKYTDELKQKLAWQAAYELRTCPPDEVLLLQPVDQQLQRHLSICHLCRQRRELQADQQQAWEALKSRFTTATVRPASGTNRQPGQVWTINSKAGGWDENGRYLQPPTILLLEQQVTSGRWLVSQLYPDERLMGQGDIELGSTFGFAQGWNCYQVSDSLLDRFIGCITQTQLQTVLDLTAESGGEPATENEVLAFFRQMERAIGARMQTQDLVPAYIPSNETVLEQLFGSIAAVYKKLTGFSVPDYAETLLDLLAGVSDPQAVMPVTAATGITLQVNIVSKQLDGALTIKTVTASLTDSNWEDGDYYVAGKLHETLPENLFLVASLSQDGTVVSECQSSIEKGSPYFDIMFSNVAEDICSINNLTFILVKP